MKKFRKNTVLVILLGLVLLSSGCGSPKRLTLISGQSNEQTPTPVTPVFQTTNVAVGQQVSTDNNKNEFNFILQYGILAKNQIDTFNGTYTKDLISAGTKTIKLRLTDTELSDIKEDMEQICILDYPEKFTPEINRYVTPNITYHLKINIDGISKEVHWEDYNCFDTPEIAKPVEPVEATKLRNALIKIIKIIEQKEEYKKLPQPVGGYD
ncbi:MAG: hypothetical protein ABFC94_07240 [Syntrophomonas sp.]